MNNVGLSIVEGVANGQSPFKMPSKRNIGLLLQAGRGIPWSPTLVKSLKDFNDNFGGQNPNFFGPAMVKSIFDEAGDALVTLYLARAVGSGALAASVSAALGATTISVKAGNKGFEDPGTWGNALSVSLYSYDYLSKGNFTLIVKQSGVQVESFSASTLALLQSYVNRTSGYVIVEFGAELTKVVYSAVTGTITSTTSSKNVVGVGTSFLTETPVGTLLHKSASPNELIGVVASVTDDTHLTLKNVASYAITAAAISKRVLTKYDYTLASGAEGSIVEADFYPVESLTAPTGLACFTGHDVQIIACTEFNSLTMAKELKAYLDGVEGPIGLVNLPLGSDENTAELWALELQSAEQSYIAGYLGWAKVLDESGNSMWIPGIAPILGAAYLRTPYVQGDYIHIPPGGIDSLFSNVVDVLPKRLSQALVNSLVRDFSCNVIQYSENTGFYVGSSRNYSTNSLYQSIHIRQMTSYYKKSLGVKMLYVGQKPSTPELKREALVDIRTFFKTEYDNGALERSVPFDTAYKGICDKSNNPSTQDRKDLNIDVLWIPTECTEAVKISLKRNDSVLTITE